MSHIEQVKFPFWYRLKFQTNAPMTFFDVSEFGIFTVLMKLDAGLSLSSSKFKHRELFLETKDKNWRAVCKNITFYQNYRLFLSPS